mmetsp:Transcript_22764/g.59506  ORF Transcript_22764/g.59506 Transcript_22764/m.59506 type:complete len:110 (+) Transcript_22764:1417-1746(+)
MEGDQDGGEWITPRKVLRGRRRANQLPAPEAETRGEETHEASPAQQKKIQAEIQPDTQPASENSPGEKKVRGAKHPAQKGQQQQQDQRQEQQQQQQQQQRQSPWGACAC